MKRIVAIALAALLAVPGSPGAGENSPTPSSSPLQPTESAGRQGRVLNSSGYGCPHCYTLEPSIEAWSKKLLPTCSSAACRRCSTSAGHDAAISTPSRRWRAQQAATGRLRRIHRDRLRSDKPAGALGVACRRTAVDANRFFDTMKSFGVQTKLRRAAQTLRRLPHRRHAGDGGARPLQPSAPSKDALTRA